MSSTYNRQTEKQMQKHLAASAFYPFQTHPAISPVLNGVLDTNSSVGGMTSDGNQIKSANTFDKAIAIIEGLRAFEIVSAFTFPSIHDIRGCFGTVKKMNQIRGDMPSGMVIIWRRSTFTVYLCATTTADVRQMIENTIDIFRKAVWLKTPTHADARANALASLAAALA